MSRHWDHQSYYEILEVDRDAHESDIRIAYHRARQTYAKDNVALMSVFTPEEAAALLELVEEAYTILSHPETRKAYDQKLVRERGDHVERHTADFFLMNAAGEIPNESFPVFQDQEAAGSELAGLDSPPIPTTDRHQGRTPLSTFEVDQEIEQTILLERDFHGSFLRIVREYKNLDIDQITEHTRIGKDYLHAIERDDFDFLPAPVFVRGFLVQLAKLYGLDEALLCSAYLERLKAHKK